MNRVLIVDDKEDNLYYLQVLLTGFGMVVEVARHGAEALSLARQSPPDLVVSDLLMPVMDGYTLLRHWKLDARLKAVPFIVYTATYTDAEDERLALNLGADAFILKPAEPDQFLARIREVQARTTAQISPNAGEADAGDLMTLYSRSLIRKLEEKTRQLEEGNRALLLDKAAREQVEAELRTVRDRLLLATQSARIGIWDWDVGANSFVWDDQMYRLYGIEDAHFSAAYDAWTSRIHADDQDRVQAEIQAAVAGIRDFQSQFRVVWPDGEVRELDANGIVQRDPGGNVMRMIGANRDITDQKASERRIRYLNRVYALLSSVNSLIVGATDRDELFRDACRVAVDIGGFKMAMIGLLGEGTIDFVAVAGSEDRGIAMVKDALAARAGTPSKMAARAIRDQKPCVSNQSQRDPMVEHADAHAAFGVQSMAILPLMLGKQTFGVLALYAGESEFFHAEEIQLLTELAGDVALASDHIENRERLDHLAYYDQLTGLANRSLFLERVAQYARIAGGDTQLAVLMFDLERFRNLNESLGRTGGDAVLKQIGVWLTGYLGDANLIARTDADHFAIVLPAQKDTREVVRLVEPMMKEFQRHAFVLANASYRLSARVGIAMYPDDGQDAELLFKRAEAALKQAKDASARYLFYARAMTESIAAKLTLESELRDALDNGEFVLHYQPKTDLRSGLLTGAEALIRWNNPRTGLVAPGLFIPVLEETGLINDVGQWALGQAVRDYLRWCDEDRPATPIAVNVSPLQLRDPRFIDEIRQALSVDPRAAGALALEITESMVMDDIDQSITRLQAIREMGISVAIDDFGTGFSSLAYLAKLPIDTLKIDRAFISNMSVLPDKLSLVATMITLAHSLKLKVVAEGVETEDEASALRGLACDQIQGYLISKPLACAEFESRFLKRRSGSVP